jgi:two-component system, chemotaxis family, chemotaxis protein CheY
MHALVIDDSRATRSVLRRILRPLGFDVTEAGDGREGLQRLGQLVRPDVVLVDWNMPVMDGLAFLRAVRADARYAGLPLLMVSTEGDAARIAQALEAGASEYVLKPFDGAVIRDKLRLLGLAAG